MCIDSSLLVPIIAATSALAGVIVSQASSAILAWISRKHQRQVLLREKYEELAHSVADGVGDFLKLLTSKTTEELLLHARPAHAQHAYILSRLYFPELKPLTQAFLASIVVFQNSLASNYNSQLPGNVGTQGVASVHVMAAKVVVENAKNALEDAIEKHASKYAIS